MECQLRKTVPPTPSTVLTHVSRVVEFVEWSFSCATSSRTAKIGAAARLCSRDPASQRHRLRIQPVTSTREPPEVLDDLKAGRPLIIAFDVPARGEPNNGLSIYGADLGAYPFDPTLTIVTSEHIPKDLGVKADESLAVDVAESRKLRILLAGDSNTGPPSKWSYTTADPGDGWHQRLLAASGDCRFAGAFAFSAEMVPFDHRDPNFELGDGYANGCRRLLCAS